MLVKFPGLKQVISITHINLVLRLTYLLTLTQSIGQWDENGTKSYGRETSLQ